MSGEIIYKGGTSTWTGGNAEDPNDTSWGFTDWNTLSNVDCLAAARYSSYTCEELAKQLAAEASRKRDLGYLAPRRPAIKRLRYRVAAPRIRFMPVFRQPRRAYRCHHRVLRCQSLRRRFACRSAGLVALRVNARE